MSPAPLTLTASQQRAVAHRGPLLRLLGPPASGVTTTAREIVVARVAAGDLAADEVLLVAATRVAAGRMRDELTARMSAAASQPMSRTLASFAFAVLRRRAAQLTLPPPVLLSGPEQDAVLGELLAGHRHGAVRGPQWPPFVEPALPTRGFRDEVRDLLMRAAEHDLAPAELAEIGRRRGRPEWVAAAQVMAEYEQVTSLSSPSALDPASLLGAADEALREDPDLLVERTRRLRLVVVDDAQELTVAGARLLQTLAQAGVDLVLAGNPDLAVQTFRGADPGFLASGWRSLGPGTTLVLDDVHRLPPAIQAVAERVAAHIGLTGTADHRPTPTTQVDPAPESVAGPPSADGGVEAVVLGAVHQEGALVAAELRREHLLNGRSYGDMAVIVRGHARTATLRRALAASGVPVVSPMTDLPLHLEPAVRPLLLVMGLALTHVRDGALPAVEDLLDLATSAIGGGDPADLRRLRRAVRASHGSDPRGTDEILVEAMLDPEMLTRLGPEATCARRVARVWQAAVRSLSGPQPDAEHVLWAIWDATGLAPRWERAALGSGPVASRADHDLDAVVALFAVATRFVDRRPGAGVGRFLEHLRTQEVPADTLTRRDGGDAVVMTTPAAAAGRSWPVVVVAGLQEGVWPDLRVRGSVLGSSELVDVLADRSGDHRTAVAAVRHDELRLFLVAVTRATERLLVSAVRTDDQQPSVLVDLVDPLPDGTQRPVTPAPPGLTLRSAVARLRRRLIEGPAADRPGAARWLAVLAEQGVPGAHPAAWWARTAWSRLDPLRPVGEPVSVSPSRVESFTRCPLRWFLTSRGGDGPAVGAATLGTLVHEVVADLGDVAADDLVAEVDARWPRLELPAGWVSDQQRRLAHAMVRRVAGYQTDARSAGWSLAGVELDVDVELQPAVRLQGRVDRLERDAGGRLRVVDYKTGSSGPTKDEVARHPQLGCYQLAVESGAFAGSTVSAGARLVHVGKRANASGARVDPQRALRDDPEPDWAAHLLAGVSAGMRGGTFAATPATGGCERCPVRHCCPAQPQGRRI